MSPTQLASVRKWICVIDGQPTPISDWHIDQEWVDVSSLSDVQPDPKWSSTAAAGHFHAYADNGDTPTLRTVAEEHWCADCHENEMTYTLRCVLCDEEITPGTVNRGPTSKSIPGLRTASLTLRYRPDVRRPLAYGSAVSVHLSSDGQEFFGTMHVVGNTFSQDEITQTLTGQLDQRMPL